VFGYVSIHTWTAQCRTEVKKEVSKMIKMKKLSAGGESFYHVTLNIAGTDFDFFGNKYGREGEYMVAAFEVGHGKDVRGTGKSNTLNDALIRAIKRVQNSMEAAA
jgi:hypothetical protein